MELHRFSPEIAELVGVESALIYEYLTYLMRRNPRKYVYASWSTLEERYCYLTIGKLRGALNRLTRRTSRNRPALLLRERKGRGYRYRPNQDEVPPPSGKMHTFYDKQAAKVGITGAIILNNFHYWIKMRWDNATDEVADARKRVTGENTSDTVAKLNAAAAAKTKHEAFYRTTVDQWQSQHPYVSPKTAKRAFQELVSQDYLRHRPGGHFGTRWSFGDSYFKMQRSNSMNSRHLDNTEGQINLVKGQINANQAILTESGAKLTQLTSILSTPAWPESTAIETDLTEAKLASQAQPENQIKEVLAQSPVGDVSGDVNNYLVGPEAGGLINPKADQQPGTHQEVRRESKNSGVKCSKLPSSPASKACGGGNGKDLALTVGLASSSAVSSHGEESVKNFPVTVESTSQPSGSLLQQEEVEALFRAAWKGKPELEAGEDTMPEEIRVRQEQRMKDRLPSHPRHPKPKVTRKSPDEVRAEFAKQSQGICLGDMTQELAIRLARSKSKPVTAADEEGTEDYPVEEMENNPPDEAAAAMESVLKNLTGPKRRKSKGKQVFESEEEKLAFIAKLEADAAADEMEDQAGSDVERIPVERIAEITAAAETSAALKSGEGSSHTRVPVDAELAEIYRRDTGQVRDPKDLDDWFVMIDHWNSKHGASKKGVVK